MRQQSIRANFFDLRLNTFQIYKCFRTLKRIPQKRRWMIDRCHLYSSTFRPLAMLLGDPKVSVNDSLRCDPPQADNDLGTDEGGLRPESYVKRDELAQVELNRERRYREIEDVPDWARDAVQELTGLGVILGTEAIQDGKVTLNMSEAQLRGLVFMKRYVDTRLHTPE